MKKILSLILLILEENQKGVYTNQNARLIHDLRMLLQGVDRPVLLDCFLPMCGNPQLPSSTECDSEIQELFKGVVEEITNSHRKQHNDAVDFAHMKMLKEEYQSQARELRK
jgi:hypothetical protein